MAARPVDPRVWTPARGACDRTPGACEIDWGAAGRLLGGTACIGGAATPVVRPVRAGALEDVAIGAPGAGGAGVEAGAVAAVWRPVVAVRVGCVRGAEMARGGLAVVVTTFLAGLGTSWVTGAWVTVVTAFDAVFETAPVTAVGAAATALTAVATGVALAAALTVLVTVLTVLVTGAAGVVGAAALTVLVTVLTVLVTGAAGVVGGAAVATGATGAAATGGLGVATEAVAEVTADVAEGSDATGLGAAAMARLGTAAMITSSKAAATTIRNRLRRSPTSLEFFPKSDETYP